MLPGPTYIRQCSICGKHISQDTIYSGNNCGATYWTDGKEDAPMLPDQPWLVKCLHCSGLVWIDEQVRVAALDYYWEPDKADEIAEQFADVREVTAPAFAEYAEFLSAGVSDRRKERYLRLRTWWAGNDVRREGGDIPPMSDLETENLRAFLGLLDETEDNDRIMKAEVLRELGMFEESGALLAWLFKDDLIASVEFIRRLNQNRNAFVADMTLKSPDQGEQVTARKLTAPKHPRVTGRSIGRARASLREDDGLAF